MLVIETPRPSRAHCIDYAIIKITDGLSSNEIPPPLLKGSSASGSCDLPGGQTIGWVGHCWGAWALGGRSGGGIAPSDSTSRSNWRHRVASVDWSHFRCGSDRYRKPHSALVPDDGQSVTACHRGFQ